MEAWVEALARALVEALVEALIEAPVLDRGSREGSAKDLYLDDSKEARSLGPLPPLD